MTRLDFKLESWRLSEPFRFAGYSVSALEVVHATLECEGIQGHGEGVVPIVFDISSDQVRTQLAGAEERLKAGQPADEVGAQMPPGPARNAFDCALWDLHAKTTGRSIWALADLPPGPDALPVDQTIGLSTPEQMAFAARNSDHAILKIKADSEAVRARISAIRAARPDAELIVDANQSWSVEDLTRLGPQLKELDVAMIEQPLARGRDAELRGLNCPVPIFADESCHTREDLPNLLGLYQGINIKLDKTGGLTEALALVRAAKDAGLDVMVGCMAGTSLSMAPAYVIGTMSKWADLDGPLLLASDRPSPMTYRDGSLSVFSPSLWG